MSTTKKAVIVLVLLTMASVACDSPVAHDEIGRVDISTGNATALDAAETQRLATEIGQAEAVPDGRITAARDDAASGVIVSANTKVSVARYGGSISVLTLASPAADYFNHSTRWEMTIGDFITSELADASWGDLSPPLGFVERSTFGSAVDFSVSGDVSTRVSARTSHEAVWAVDGLYMYKRPTSDHRTSFGSGSYTVSGRGGSGSTDLRGDDCGWFDIYVDGNYKGRFWVCV